MLADMCAKTSNKISYLQKFTLTSCHACPGGCTGGGSGHHFSIGTIVIGVTVGIAILLL